MTKDRSAEPSLFDLAVETEKPSEGVARDSTRSTPGSRRARGALSVAPNRAVSGSSPDSLGPRGSAVPSPSLPDDLAAVTLPHLLDITALAEHLGVTPRHVRRLVAERRVPFVRWGHLIRFDPAEIAGWLERARIPGNDVA